MSIQFYNKKDGKLHKSNATYFEYPGGESSIKYNEGDLSGNEVAYVRGAEAIDLIRLAMWSDAVANDGGFASVIMPYLPGARADKGSPRGASVYATILDWIYSSGDLICFDPHSEYMTSRLYNLYPIQVDSSRLIRSSLGLATFHHAEHDDYRAKHSEIEPIVGVIAPDKGAVDRASKAATALGVKLYHAEKHRDFDSGKLSGFTCEPLPDSGSLLVVDDICDGGGTFLGLADAIDLPPERLALWVSHGIFSKGVNDLLGRFGKIVTTDSHPGSQGYAESAVKVIPILYHLAEYVKETK